MTLQMHYFDYKGEHIIDCANVLPEDAEFFERNDIKVSTEELRGQFIVYGCPYSDESEESEVIVFSNSRSCEETLSELAAECRKQFNIT